MRQLLTNPAMANHFRLRILHYSYSTLMDACINGPPQDPIPEQYIPIKGKYKMADRVTSKNIRLESKPEPTAIEFKLPADLNDLERALPKLNKLKCVRTKSFALRLINGDIYTGTKLLRFGLSDNDECTKCREQETIEHLLMNCWYSGLIWTKLKKLYMATDNRRQLYDPSNLGFVIGSRLSNPKLKLHLEIIRRLCARDRPGILPRMIISQALDYLIICDTNHFKYYKRLKQALLIT